MRNVTDKIYRHNQTLVMSNNFCRKACRLWDNVEKYDRFRQVKMTICIYSAWVWMLGN